MARTIDEGRRREIADGALQVLRDRGVQKTTMSDIARALEMKRPTLYWYFPDIHAIFDYSLRQMRQEEARFVGERLLGVSHPVDALIAFIEADHAFFVERGVDDYLLMMCQYFAAGGPEMREASRALATAGMLPVRTLLIGMVEQGVAAGTVREVDPTELVDFLLAYLNGALVQAVLAGTLPSATNPFLREHILEPLRCNTVH